MTGERTYPVLPCADLDVALEFYGALGFTTTFSQHRPYPAAVVARDDLHIHLSGIDGFDPEASYASVIITVPEPAEMHAAFTAGLREHYGKVPLKGIPRILPLRRKAGTATGFSVVDAGGNWLRFYRTPAAIDGPEEEDPRTGLLRVIDVAARQGDARGDEAQAIKVLDSGLTRYADAPASERLEALLYRAELKLRIDRDATDDLAAADTLVQDHELGADAAAQVTRIRAALEE
jgi:catechol 2,3-dioxygenase-like lactoylglutathione lyase family enzyme